MGFLIGLLTFILVMDCLLLIFLVLMQLPKKEAGMGQAFGGGATDALFGPGSGNVLTKTTKYAAGMFLVLSLILSVLGSNRAASKTQNIKDKLNQKAAATPAPMLPVPGTPNSQIAPPANALPVAIPATNTIIINPSNAPPAAPAVKPAAAPAPAPAPAPAAPATNKPAAAAPAPTQTQPVVITPSPSPAPAAPAPVKK